MNEGCEGAGAMATIGIIGSGAMGSAIGARLVENGAQVLTYLEGRSAATRERARAAGMQAAGLDGIVGADIVLSIVPPAEAVGVAGQICAAMREHASKPPFMDCNAISPNTMGKVSASFDPDGPAVLDGSIIGAPPKPGQRGPRLYVSGDVTGTSEVLSSYGLQVRRIEGPVGAASALKMCYAGINKGVIGLGTAMLLAAIRSGADPGLRRELEESLPEFDRKFSAGIPDMYAKAYRWVAEMEEIAEFLGKDDPAALIFRGMAGLYRQMAEDRAAGGADASRLDAVLAARPKSA
jgi:3-hydroxyisobutyrate dehydrogenase-like beta-hydroxyacid dehydrogenase